MKIGLISDTHGYIDAWRKALDYFIDADLVIHTGDILSSGPFNPRTHSYRPAELAKSMNEAPFTLLFAKGNCDAEVDSIALDYPIQSPYLMVAVDGLKILATHGHLQNDEELTGLGRRYKLNIIVSGHTHVNRILKSDGLYLVNPGSASLPKGAVALGSVGLIEDGTIRIISLEDGSVLERVEIK